MRFFTDSDLVLPVEWYFVPSTRPVIPYANAFTSRQYDIGELVEPHLGERYAPRFWRGGEVPRIVGEVGLCGSEEKWGNGASVLDPVLPKWNATQVPKCCGNPGLRALFGLGVGHVDSTIVINPKGGLGVGGAV